MKQFQRAHSRDHHQSLIIEGKACKVREREAVTSIGALPLAPHYVAIGSTRIRA